MNLNQLMTFLSTANPEAKLVFSTEAGDIGSGYHVTEFKLAQIKGIDCGGRVTDWSEVAIQLLDGSGGTHMSVTKFTGILKKSIARVDGLGDVEAHVEFSPSNNGLRSYTLSDPIDRGSRVLIKLRAAGAACKPAQDAGIGLEKSNSNWKPVASTGSESVSKRCCG